MRITILAFLALVSVSSGQSDQDYLSFIRTWEGKSNHVYIDSLGNRTIGIGHALRKDENFSYLSDYHVERICLEDIKTAQNIVRSHIKDFDLHPTLFKLIMVDMAFNLGSNRFCSFKNMIRACNDRDYLLVSHEMRESKWYSQVGKRSKHHVKALKNLGAMQNDL